MAPIAASLSIAPADGSASRQSRLRQLPQGDGPARFRAENFDATGKWRTSDSGSPIDHRAEYGQEDLLPSLQVGIEDPGANTGVCGWGYSCAYTNSISWAGAAKPLPHEINPQVVFERLYGDGASPEQRLARKKASASILDRVMGRISDVNKSLAAPDRSRLNEYLENVREVERRVPEVGRRRPGIARTSICRRARRARSTSRSG